MNLKKLMAGLLVSATTISLAACGASAPGTSTASSAAASSSTAAATSTAEASSTAAPAEASASSGAVSIPANVDSSVKIAMITDTGGINDQSFNQSAWEGLQQLTKDTGIKTNYIESKQASDFVNNFNTLIDQGNTLCWGIGYACYDGIKQAAQDNPDIHFAIVDNNNQDSLDNLTGVVFRAQESSFMVGYIAAATTKTNKVGFVGGVSSATIDQFEWGYKAGVAYANKELGKNVTVDSQYAESFSDAAKGKSIANKMFTDNYIESKQASDFVNNFNTLIDQGNTLCWGIGYACYDGIKQAAQDNPDIHFAIVDNNNQDSLDNLTGVVFRAQESSFMVGYIAAATTKTNKVGFVGGVSSATIDQFEWGYKAGVAYANKELGKNVTVDSQYAESFSDAAKGKSIANKMFTDGADIVYHAAGGTGQGVIEAAKDANKFAIGVDRDQNYLAPENVLTSALKNVNVAVEDLSAKFASGQKLPKDVEYGLKENAVGISTDHHLYSDDTYNAALKIGDDIKAGKITPPANKKDYEDYVKTLG